MTKLWRTKMVVSKCPCLTFSAVMLCLDAKISLVPSIVPHSTFNLIGPCNTHPHRQSHAVIKPQSQKDTCTYAQTAKKGDLVLLHYSLYKETPSNDQPLTRITKHRPTGQLANLATIWGDSTTHYKQPITETILWKSENQWI